VTTPDFKKVLLSRHGENDTICVTAYKLRGGKQIAVQRFCAGVEQAAGLIGRAYEREDMDSVAVDIDPACCEAARNFIPRGCTPELGVSG